MTRGIVFTIDAVLAMAIAGILSSMTFVMLAKANAAAGVALEQNELGRVASDLLASMEKSGVLAQAASSGSPIPLDDFLGIMPRSVCARVLVKNTAGAIVLSSSSSCSCGTRTLVKKRDFVLIRGGALETYLSEARACGA